MSTVAAPRAKKRFSPKDPPPSESDMGLDPAGAVEACYARGETDEFIRPLVVHRDGLPVAPMRAGDCRGFPPERSGGASRRGC